MAWTGCPLHEWYQRFDDVDNRSADLQDAGGLPERL